MFSADIFSTSWLETNVDLGFKSAIGKKATNPASERVFVEGIRSENTAIKLISTEGKIAIDNLKLDSENSFDITGITSGVYYLNIKSGDFKEYSQKLIIK